MATWQSGVTVDVVRHHHKVDSISPAPKLVCFGIELWVKLRSVWVVR